MRRRGGSLAVYDVVRTDAGANGSRPKSKVKRSTTKTRRTRRKAKATLCLPVFVFFVSWW